MERNELVTAILDLFDKAENRKTETVVVEKEVNRALTPNETALIEYAKKNLLKEVLYSWRTVTAKRQEDSSVKYTSFQDYIKEAIQRSNIPDNFSYADFLLTMKEELLKKYEEEKIKSLKLLEDSEKEAKKNEEN